MFTGLCRQRWHKPFFLHQNHTPEPPSPRSQRRFANSTKTTPNRLENSSEVNVPYRRAKIALSATQPSQNRSRLIGWLGMGGFGFYCALLPCSHVNKIAHVLRYDLAVKLLGVCRELLVKRGFLLRQIHFQRLNLFIVKRNCYRVFHSHTP